jgi:hypothetical protein
MKIKPWNFVLPAFMGGLLGASTSPSSRREEQRVNVVSASEIQKGKERRER